MSMMMRGMYKHALMVGVLLACYALQATPVRFIAPADITASALTVSRGLIILTEDVTYAGGGTAITIGASGDDVVLDLNGKTINATAGGTGISTSAARSNIVIKNGTLRGFTGSGISIFTGSRNIRIENVTIIGPAPASGTGITFAGAATSATRTVDCFLTNCQVNGFSVGFAATAADKINITNSRFNNNLIRGLNMSDCNFCQFIQSQASAQSAPTEAKGIALNGCSCWHIEDSDFSINNATAGPSTGVFIDNTISGTSGGHEIFNSMFCRNGGSGASVGLDLVNASSCVIRDCLFNGNFSTGSTARGISLTSTGHFVENCVANGNYSAGAFAVHGFILTGSAHRLLNCHAAGNAATGAAVGTGFELATTATLCMVEKCTAISNSVRGFVNDAGAGVNLFIGNLSFGHSVAGVNNYTGANPPPFFPAIPAVGPYPLAGTFDERGLANLSFS